MDCDAEKVIAAVESRPVIFNFTLKEYKNRNVVDKAWEEVASEMNVSVADCRTKWASIRNSYNRALRESECQPSGSKGGKRKKWYLMDALEFLRDFTGTHRKSVSNLPPSSTIEEMDTPQDESQEAGDQEEGLSSSATPTSTTALPPPPKSKTSAAEKVAGPMIDLKKSRTKPSEKESSTLSFFKGIVEEVDSLPPAKKMNFKVDVMNLLRLPSPSCALIKYSSWDEIKHTDIGVFWSPLEFTPSIITRMRVSMPFAAVAVLLLLMATLAALIGHCNNDHKTLIACALYTLAGLSLASGLVVFASVVSDVALERPKRSNSPGFQYRYGWSFFSAGAAFVLSEVAAVLCITAYLRRFPTAEHMVRAVVPGAERKLLASRHSDYGVRTPSEHNKELLVPSFEETLEGPLLPKPPDLCNPAPENQCQSCKKEQERQLAGTAANSTTVPITLGTLTLRPQRTTPAFEYNRRYATLGHTGILHAGVLGVHEGGGNWSSGSSPSSGSSCPRPPRKHHKNPAQPPQAVI